MLKVEMVRFSGGVGNGDALPCTADFLHSPG